MFRNAMPFFMMDPTYQLPTRNRRNRTNRRKDITFEDIREFRRFLKEMHEDTLLAEEQYKTKYNKKEEKKEELKRRGWNPFEVTLLLTLLSPVIGLGVINLYVYMYHAMQVAIKGLQ